MSHAVLGATCSKGVQLHMCSNVSLHADGVGLVCETCRQLGATWYLQHLSLNGQNNKVMARFRISLKHTLH